MEGGPRRRTRAVRRAAWAVGALLLASLTVAAIATVSRDARIEPADPPGLVEALPDLDGVVWAGVPLEGIPAIDEPRFLSVDEAERLPPTEPVISLEIDGDARAYPVRILMFHEIVNDEVGGIPVTVTYCPLCNTGIAFERPEVEGRHLSFGVSGSLLHGNLLMYDRQTQTYWAQVTGEAIEGPLVGTRLTLAPAQMLSWRDWKRRYPDGKVLETPIALFIATKSGRNAPYGTNPYHYYDLRPPAFFTGEVDPRLPPKARVLGLQRGDETVAFPYRELRKRSRSGWAALNTTVGGEPVAVLWRRGTNSALDTPRISEGRDVGAIAAFDPVVDGQVLRFRPGGEGLVDDRTGSRWSITGHAVDGPLEGTRLRLLTFVDGFWFDWAAFHPGTSVFGLR